MSLEYIPLMGLADSTTGALVALVNPSIPGGQQFLLSPGGSSGVVVTPLVADHVLSSADDNTIFFASATVLVTVPDGLNPKPNCGFFCPAAGSITIRMGAAATHDGGLTSDVVKTRATDPWGFNVSPVDLPTDVSKHDYAISAGFATFATLPDPATNNASLVALFPQIVNMAEYSQVSGTRIRSSLGGALTLDPAQCVHGGATPPGVCLRNISNGNRVVTLPTGMPLGYWFELRHDTAQAGVTTSVAKSGGVSWNPRQVGGSDALKLASQGFAGFARMYGVDQWEFLGSDWTV